MSVIVSCPKCQKKLKIEDSALGKNIKCPGCAAVFATKAPADAAAPPAAPKKAAPPPDDEVEDEAPRRPAKAASRTDDDEDDRPAKKPAAKAARDDDYEDDDRPAKKPAAKKSRDDDDDDDRPTKKSAAKKGRDDDEDNDRPAKKSAAKKGRSSDDDDDDDRRTKKAKKKGGGAGKVLAIVGVIILLLCGGCGGLAYYFVYKAGDVISGAMTDLQKRMTGPEFQVPTAKQGPVLPGADTKKTAGGRGEKPDGLKPADGAKFASEQQLADAMVDNSTQAMATYGFLLQLTGKVTKVTTTPDGKVSEVFFEPQVEDLKTKQKKPFPINCRFTTPVTLPRTIGKTITVRGNLTGGGNTSATLNECVLVP